MPELPDITLYCEALAQRIMGATIERIDLPNPFVLRTAVPAVDEALHKRVQNVHSQGKRVVIGLEEGLYLVLHLMIAGRLRWLEPKAKAPGRGTLALFTFSSGRLAFTEAGTKRRAALHLLRGTEALATLDAGGLDVRNLAAPEFAARLTSENHTLKRALTDPRLFSGIGNAYSDEILHRARLSPLALTQKLEPSQITALHVAACAVLNEWIERLRNAAAGRFPEKVSAFRPEMAVHGKYNEPCPVCGAPVQRIVYAENECNYCARCQTGGVVLADRALSRLLHKSWPRSIDAIE
ncbi:MAG: formamidopyrimidine-DNA glycosylase [Pseudomonadota bacterium]|nr:formamidopyrimidine-DNA glycosylase [Pseudomonadota bacterium]